MKKSALLGLVATAALAAPSADAARITGATSFSVEFFDLDSGELLYEGPGFFELRADRVVDFEFTMLGFTWTEEDVVGNCDCVIEPDGSAVESIVIEFQSSDGRGALAWRFDDGTFSLFLSTVAGGLGGTSDRNVFGGGPTIDAFLVVSEPATALLGLLLLPFLRRRR